MEILYSNLGNLTWQQVVMWAIGGLRRNSGKSSDVGCD